MFFYLFFFFLQPHTFFCLACLTLKTEPCLWPINVEFVQSKALRRPRALLRKTKQSFKYKSGFKVLLFSSSKNIVQLARFDPSENIRNSWSIESSFFSCCGSTGHHREKMSRWVVHMAKRKRKKPFICLIFRRWAQNIKASEYFHSAFYGQLRRIVFLSKMSLRYGKEKNTFFFILIILIKVNMQYYRA